MAKCARGPIATVVLSFISVEEQGPAAEALAAIAGRYEEALAGGVIAPEGFGLAQLAVASSALRFAIVEKELGVRVLPAAPRFEALVRRLAQRPSILETVPDDYAKLLIRKLVERRSLYAARAMT